MGKPLQVSNNTLATVAKCSTATVLRYGLMRESANEAPALKAGSAVHTCLEVWWRGGTRKEALVAFRKEYKQWAEENIDPDDKWKGNYSWENMRKLMGFVLARYPLEVLPFKVDPTMVEVSFAVPLTKKGDVELIGIMDAANVRMHRTRKLAGVDHKTTKAINAPWFLPQFRMGSQMTGYLWASREMTPEPVIGIYVNAIQLGKLPYLSNPERKCAEHGMEVQDCWAEHVNVQLILIERTAEQITSWKRDAIRLAYRYMDLLEDYPTPDHLPKVPQEGKYNGSCTMCDYQEFCFAGRPVDRLEHMTSPREERAEWRV